MINLQLHIDRWFSINGVEHQTSVPYGTLGQLIWINDTHVGMKTKRGTLLCMRVNIAEEALTLQK